jgi:hypothetical protein
MSPCRTIRDAAQQFHVCEGSIQRWLKDPQFQEDYRVLSLTIMNTRFA